MSVLERVADRLTGGTFTQLREAVTDLERELEDLGWYSLSGAGSDTEFKLDDRRKLLKKCYLYWRKAPLAGAVTRMMADFTFGQGLATPKVEDPKAQEFISGIWDDPDNQRILFGHQAQQLVNNKLWYEGELFIVHFFAKDASVRLRLLNASEIEDIITDPEDRNTPLYYKRMPRRRRYDFPSHTWAPTDLTAQPEYHADIGLADWLEDPENKKRARKAGLVDQATKPGEVMHVKVNCDVNDLRGIPPLYRSVDWVKAHRTMAGDLATFIKALSIWAWKKKVKGGSGIVSAAKARFHTDLDNLTNPPPATGSVHVENLASDLQPINTPTGGATLHSQGLRAMVLQVAAASGIMEHYFGDPSTGNLATATSMELPMVKLFMSNQQLWRDIYLRILREALRRGGFDRGGKLPEIEIEFPPILSREVASYVHAVVEAGMMGYLDGPVASELIMRALGVKDIEKELKKMIGEGETKPLTESDRRRAADLIFMLRRAREEIKREYASSHADTAS
jgi:hypothetical protein